MSQNEEKVDLSIKEKLNLLDTYDKLNLSTVPEREAVVKLEVLK